MNEEVTGKHVLFIPTASIREEYTGYIDSARDLWRNMGANLFEVELSTATEDETQQAFAKADIVYVSGGNTFFLIDQIRKTSADKLINEHLASGKLYVGESAGSIICAPDLTYIQPMDPVPSDYSQDNFNGLGLVDFHVVPHYGCFPFEASAQQILDEHSDLNLWAITNNQAILVEDGMQQELSIE